MNEDVLFVLMVAIYLIGGLVITAATISPILEEDRGITRGDIVVGILFIPHIAMFLLIAGIAWLCTTIYNQIDGMNNKLTKWWTTPLRKRKE